MRPRSEHEVFRVRDGRTRFDADSVRRILERAAVEQHRLDKELDESYSREELEEMAAEAGISRSALRAAIDDSTRVPHRSRRWRPGRGSAVRRRLAVATVIGVGVVGLAGAATAFPIVAYILFWTTIVLWVLILAGASPF